MFGFFFGSLFVEVINLLIYPLTRGLSVYWIFAKIGFVEVMIILTFEVFPICS